MSDIWFISDTHFCDEDIMRFEPILPDGVHTRADLDEYIIERWNSVVQPEDVVYHLGDVGKFSSEEDAKQIIKRLNGDKYLIMGNHDYEIPRHVSTPFTLRNFWEYSGFLMAYTNRFFLGEYTILTHQPPQFTNAPYLWLFGHVHTSQLYRTVTRNAICVCADRWNFTPVSIDIIQDMANYLMVSTADIIIITLNEFMQNMTLICFISISIVTPVLMLRW